MKMRGMGSVYERGGIWWISYYHNGKQRRESSESTKRPDAVALLKQRHEELGQGRPASEAEKVTLADLKALVVADYGNNGRRSLKRVTGDEKLKHAGGSWAHLAGFFGERERAVAITAPRLAAYVTARREAGAAANTLRNELSALRRAFRLARETGTLLPNETPAAFPKIKPGAARAGFFERAEHEAVRAALPPDEGDVAEFLFWSGWRKGEALGLRWRDVDEKAGVIRIETTKSDEPRTLPYAALLALEQLVKHRREVTDRVQRKRDMVVTHVFHRNGDPILTFNRSWAAACVAAGLGREIRKPDRKDAKGKVRAGQLERRIVFRIPHDYRRSAARNLSRAGVPERVIMQLCGWKTRSVFDRYRIVAERDLAEGLARLASSPPPDEGRRAYRLRGRRR